MAATAVLERWPRTLEPILAARAYLGLSKPGITALVAATCAVGFTMAAAGVSARALLLNTLVATILTSAGAAALNHVREADADRRMRRTASRPIPSGAIARGRAATFAAALTITGLTWAAVLLPWSTTALLALCHTTYVAAYTPLKRITPWCTVVGTVPGALPVLVGWSATGAPLTTTALALTGVLVLWQIPHFLAIGWLCRADYARAGFRVLSTVHPDGGSSGRVSLAFTLALVPVSLVPFLAGDAGVLYAVVAGALGAAYVRFGAAFAVRRDDVAARRLFLTSLVYLPVLFVALLLGARR